MLLLCATQARPINTVYILTSPTRRSSDLPADLPAIFQLLEQAGLPRDGLDAHVATTLAAKDGQRLVGTAAPYSSRAAVPTNLDRKSTRLNSSHTVSSYAAFCLKQKNKYMR